ncbi:MAG: hypothetical protein P8M05_11175 [Flavobacteriales bacterium]|nr:hypothetical protein [Flavobacteriales bacterium]
MEILNTDIRHNERWPRQGVMFVPTFLLKKGDLLTFNFNSKIEGRELNIHIEKTDSKADGSPNRALLKKISISNIDNFEIPEDSLYNFAIENPSSADGLVGSLKLELTQRSESYSPFIERFYETYLEKDGDKTLKKCKDWGYREDIGANILTHKTNSNGSYILFNSKESQYHFSQTINGRITNTIFFEASKGEKIFFDISAESFENFIVVNGIEKINSVGLIGNLSRNQEFISNEDAIYKFESYIYRCKPQTTDPFPDNFSDVIISSNMARDTNSFTSKYDLIQVYNEIFNRTEMEPIKKVANTVYSKQGKSWFKKLFGN